jgi:hypothetical protein
MMPNHQIKLFDNATGEILEFNTLQKACDYINSITGGKLGPSQLYTTFQRCGTVAKKRFSCICNQGKEPDRVYREDGWEYDQYEVANVVISAEKKLKWYDEERIKEITDYLRRNRCKVFWDLGGDYYGYERSNTRVEIYKKFPEDVPFESKVLVMKKILSQIEI